MTNNMKPAKKNSSRVAGDHTAGVTPFSNASMTPKTHSQAELDKGIKTFDTDDTIIVGKSISKHGGKKNMKRNVFDIAKAGLCTSIASATALTGITPFAFAAPVANDDNTNVIPAADDQISQALEDAKAALDEANTLVNSATQEELDSLDALDNATSAVNDKNRRLAVVQENVQSARTNRDLAFSQIVSNGTQNVNDRNVDVENAIRDLENANAELDDAKNAYENAQTAYDEAKKAYDDAMAAQNALGERPSDTIVEDATSDYEQAQKASQEAAAKLEQANSNVTTATQKVQDAEIKKNQTASALATAEAERATAQRELATAQAKLDDASEEMIAEFQAQVDSFTELKATKDQIVIQEQQNLATIESNLEQYKTELALAKEAQAEAKAACDRLDNIKSEIEENDVLIEKMDKELGYSEKQKAWEEAALIVTQTEEYLKQMESRLDEARQEHANAEWRVADAQNRLLDAIQDAATTGEAPSVSLGAYLTDNDTVDESALAQLLQAVPKDQMGLEGDATDWINITTALRVIDFINQQRAFGLGDNTPLSVSTTQMVLAAIKANDFAANNTGWKFEEFNIDVTSPPIEGELDGENENEFAGESNGDNSMIDMMPENQISLKYSAGSAAWEFAQQNGYFENEMLPEGWEQMKASELRALVPNFFETVEIYRLFIMPASSCKVGVGINTVNGRTVVGISYSEDDENELSTSCSEWSERFEQWLVDKLQTNAVESIRGELSNYKFQAQNLASDVAYHEYLVNEAIPDQLEALRADANEKDKAFALIKDQFEDYLYQGKVLAMEQEEAEAAQAENEQRKKECDDEVTRIQALVDKTEESIEPQKEKIKDAEDAAKEVGIDLLAWEGSLSSAKEQRSKALAEVDDKNGIFNEKDGIYKESKTADEAAQEELEQAQGEKNNSDVEQANAYEDLTQAQNDEQDKFAYIATAQKTKDDWNAAQIIIDQAFLARNAAEDAQRDAQTEFEAAERAQQAAESQKSIADQRLATAQDFLNRAQEAADNAAAGLDVTDPVFANAASYIDIVKAAEQDVVAALQEQREAIAAQESAQARVDEARAKRQEAIAAQQAAQITYDSLLAAMPETPEVPPVNPDDDNNDENDNNNGENTGDDNNGGDTGDNNGGNTGDNNDENDNNNNTTDNDNNVDNDNNNNTDTDNSNGDNNDENDNSDNTDNSNDDNGNGNANDDANGNNGNNADVDDEEENIDAPANETVVIDDDETPLASADSMTTSDGATNYFGDTVFVSYPVTTTGTGGYTFTAGGATQDATDNGIDNTTGEELIEDETNPLSAMESESSNNDALPGILGMGAVAIAGAALVASSIVSARRRKEDVE